MDEFHFTFTFSDLKLSSLQRLTSLCFFGGCAVCPSIPDKIFSSSLLHSHPTQLMTQPPTRQRQETWDSCTFPSHPSLTMASCVRERRPSRFSKGQPFPVAPNQASRHLKDETPLLPAFSCSSHSIPQLRSLLVLPYGPSCFLWAFQPAPGSLPCRDTDLRQDTSSHHTTSWELSTDAAEALSLGMLPSPASRPSSILFGSSFYLATQ